MTKVQQCDALLRQCKDAVKALHFKTHMVQNALMEDKEEHLFDALNKLNEELEMRPIPHLILMNLQWVALQTSQVQVLVVKTGLRTSH